MCAICIDIKVACSLYKLAHGIYYFQLCNKMFTIGKSFMNIFLHEFVITINVVF